MRKGDDDGPRGLPFWAGIVRVQAPRERGELRVVERVEEPGEGVVAAAAAQGVEPGRPPAGLEVGVDLPRVGVERGDRGLGVEGGVVPGEDRDLGTVFIF